MRSKSKSQWQPTAATGIGQDCFKMQVLPPKRPCSLSLISIYSHALLPTSINPNSSNNKKYPQKCILPPSSSSPPLWLSHPQPCQQASTVWQRLQRGLLLTASTVAVRPSSLATNTSHLPGSRAIPIARHVSSFFSTSIQRNDVLAAIADTSL
jgi:hypothetical protein